jgi:hypothetical protein
VLYLHKCHRLCLGMIASGTCTDVKLCTLKLYFRSKHVKVPLNDLPDNVCSVWPLFWWNISGLHAVRMAQSVLRFATNWSLRGSDPTKGFCVLSRPAQRPTEPPVQWVPGVHRPTHGAALLFPYIAGLQMGRSASLPPIYACIDTVLNVPSSRVN